MLIFALEPDDGFAAALARCLDRPIAALEDRRFADGEGKLRPLVDRHPNLALDPGFLRIFERSLGASNRVVLLSQPARRIEILNADQGTSYEGLWLSSTRWIDQGVLEIPGALQPQRRSYQPTGLQFA